ncbi:lysostaphin resistance A-like protein [Pseudoneobacillus sp. C159]
MLADQLARPLSKKLLIALLMVAIGEDIALYLSRESYFMETIYSNLMLFSILVAMKLAPRLKDEATVGSVSKGKLFSTFVKAFVLLYIVGIVNDVYSSQVFTAFSEDRSLIAEDFSERVADFEEGAESKVATTTDRVFEWIDTIGADFYNYFLAGLEEVWRLSYIVLFLVFFKKLMPSRWERSSKTGFLIIAVILSSLLFGNGHSLSYEQSWPVWIGTLVCYTNMGLVLGYLLVTTRNLWLMVVVHGLYNVLTTMTWSYFAHTTELFIGLLLLVNGVVLLVARIQRKAVEAREMEL